MSVFDKPKVTIELAEYNGLIREIKELKERKMSIGLTEKEFSNVSEELLWASSDEIGIRRVRDLLKLKYGIELVFSNHIASGDLSTVFTYRKIDNEK